MQLVQDLRTLRALAEYLLRFDAVTFLMYLENLRATEGVTSVWLFHDAAHTIFEQVCILGSCSRQWHTSVAHAKVLLCYTRHAMQAVSLLSQVQGSSTTFASCALI